MAISSWRLRAPLALISAAILLLPLYFGYAQQLSLEEAAKLVQLIEENEREIFSSGDASEIVFKLFTIEASVVLACSLPGAGPAVAMYLSYETGRYARAVEAVGFTGARQPGLSDALHFTVLCIVLTESIYLTLMLSTRKRWDPLETAALIILALSLAALISVLEAASL